MKIQSQTLMLMMILNHLKHQEKFHSFNSLGAQEFVGTTPTQNLFMRNFHTPVKKLLPPGKECFVFKKIVKVIMLYSVQTHVC